MTADLAAAPAVFHCPACCPLGAAERRGFDDARALYARPYPPPRPSRTAVPLLLAVFLAAFVVGYLLTAPEPPPAPAPAAKP